MSKTTFSGVVKRTLVNPGSKSEHTAIVLDTGNGKLMPLRVRGGNSFDYSPFQPFVGWKVEVKGEAIGGSVLLVDSTADITKKQGAWPSPRPKP